jgi:hypothetical protein
MSHEKEGTGDKTFRNEVLQRGLEPLRLAALDPKSSASTNFATEALLHSFLLELPGATVAASRFVGVQALESLLEIS